MKTRLIVVALMIASSQAMAGGAEIACSVANGVIMGNDGRQVAEGAIYSSSGAYGGQGSSCVDSAVVPYAIDGAYNAVMGSPEDQQADANGYYTQKYGGVANTVKDAAQQAAMAEYYGTSGSSDAYKRIGTEILLNAVFGR